MQFDLASLSLLTSCRELYPDGDDSDLENEPSSLENSMDNDCNFAEAAGDPEARYRYGITPPSNAREREKV